MEKIEEVTQWTAVGMLSFEDDVDYSAEAQYLTRVLGVSMKVEREGDYAVLYTAGDSEAVTFMIKLIGLGK